MMFWYGHDVGGWGWFAMPAGMILFWAVVITVGILLFRALSRGPEHAHPHTSLRPSPERVLAERYARGEIDEDEYRRRLATLHSAGPPAEP